MNKDNYVININDYTTYPKPIIDFVRQNKNLLLGRDVLDCLTFEIRWDNEIKKDNKKIIAFREKLYEMLYNYQVEVYHLSKVINKESFYKNGIELLTPRNYVKRMAEIFDYLSLTTEWKNKYFNLMLNFANDRSQMSGRENRLSLFAPASKELIYDENYVGMYSAVIGGEFAKFAFGKDKEAYREWQKYGVKVLVKTIINFNSLIKGLSEVNFDDSVVMFLRCILQYEHWIPMEKIVFIAQTDCNIPPQHIVDIRDIN